MRPFCHRTDEGLGRWTMRVVGFVMLGTTLPQLFTFRVRLTPRTSGPWVEWASFKEPAYAFSLHSNVSELLGPILRLLLREFDLQDIKI